MAEYYRDKKVEDMTREELIVALREMNELFLKALESNRSNTLAFRPMVSALGGS